MPVTDESLKMLLSHLAQFIQWSEGATEGRKVIIISILLLGKKKEAEALWHVHLPGEVSEGVLEKKTTLSSPANFVSRTVRFYGSWITAE